MSNETIHGSLRFEVCTSDSPKHRCAMWLVRLLLFLLAFNKAECYSCAASIAEKRNIRVHAYMMLTPFCNLLYSIRCICLAAQSFIHNVHSRKCTKCRCVLRVLSHFINMSYVLSLCFM